MATIFSKFKDPFNRRKEACHLQDKQKNAEHSCSFNRQREMEEAYESVKRGISMVPLEKITGSVGRYHDFDRQFRTFDGKKDERLQAIMAAMKAGKKMEPISLYQIKDDYYILDGHHRVKAARNLGLGAIRAQIVELLPSKDTLENRLYIEKTHFRDGASLAQNIDLTELGMYRHLEHQIEEHRQFLESDSGRPLSCQEAAMDWYSTIYKPLSVIIESSGLKERFPGRTVADLYLYISLHQWEQGKKRTYGTSIDQLIPRDMEEFRRQMMEYKEQNYPDMRRQMTVFILLNVDGRYEQRIFDKLFALKEVKEVHSVHGSIDIIVKVVLERDLLSSDAEQLTQFILNSIRKWTGVISTQTLIPGISRSKEEDI